MREDYQIDTEYGLSPIHGIHGIHGIHVSIGSNPSQVSPTQETADDAAVKFIGIFP